MSKLHLKQRPTLADIQQYLCDMTKERGFDKETVVQNYVLLVEEVGELGKVIRKTHAGLRIDANKKYELDAASEIADILMLLGCIANILGIDIEQAFRDKEEKNKTRTWK